MSTDGLHNTKFYTINLTLPQIYLRSLRATLQLVAGTVDSSGNTALHSAVYWKQGFTLDLYFVLCTVYSIFCHFTTCCRCCW